MTIEKGSERHRMVVEEVEIPSKIQESLESEIINEETKISSDELIKNENVQLTDRPIPEEVRDQPEKPSYYEQIANIRSSNRTNKQSSPVLWILIPGIFILGAILGGIVFYQNHTSPNENKNTPTPQASSPPLATVVPSTAPNVNLSEYDIAIYNGSGIAGEAGKVKTLLEDAGFTVVSTGNAATYDYTKTIIKAKSSIDASVISILEEALGKSYIVGDSQTLSSSSTTDIQIVVGSSKAE